MIIFKKKYLVNILFLLIILFFTQISFTVETQAQTSNEEEPVPTKAELLEGLERLGIVQNEEGKFVEKEEPNLTKAQIRARNKQQADEAAENNPEVQAPTDGEAARRSGRDSASRNVEEARRTGNVNQPVLSNEQLRRKQRESAARARRRARRTEENRAKPEGYVPLEPLPGIATGPNDTVNLPAYLTGMFKIGIGIASVLAVLMIVVAGMQYIGGAASPSARYEANGRITSAILGLFVAMSSWLVLSSIDVNLIRNTLDVTPVDTGVSSVQGGVTEYSLASNPEAPSNVSNSSGTNIPTGVVDPTTGSVSGTGVQIRIDPGNGAPTIVGGEGTITRDSLTGACIITGSAGSAVVREAKCDKKNGAGFYFFADENGNKDPKATAPPNGGGDNPNRPAPEVDVDNLASEVATLISRIKSRVIPAAVDNLVKTALGNRMLDLEFQMNKTINGATFEQIMIDANETKDMKNKLLSIARAVPIGNGAQCGIKADMGAALCIVGDGCGGLRLLTETESFTCGVNLTCCGL